MLCDALRKMPRLRPGWRWSILLGCGLLAAPVPAAGQYPTQYLARLQAPPSPAPETLPTPPPSSGDRAASPTGTGIPAEFAPWWQEQVSQPLDPRSLAVPVAPEGLVLSALANSAQVRVFRNSVMISQTAICEAAGSFDPRAFAESKYIKTNDPVGSTLTTGGPDRWLDSNWYASTGLRTRMVTGAEIEASQKIGYEDSNSLYFVPPYQGTSRLCLRLTKPLLNGAGKAYNTSIMVLADINTNIACDRFSKDLQSLLLDIHRAYWDLYLQRAALLQRRRLYQQALNIRTDLNARRDVDVLRGQIARAEAAVANREGAVIRYQAAVRNTEARLRAMVNDPVLRTPETAELIPNQLPTRGYLPVSLADTLVTALHHRPEIQQGIKEIRAAGVRADVAANEVLPVLNAVVEAYVSGLNGYGQIGRSLGDEFSNGGPSYTVGLQYEMPLGGNRTASARLQKRRLELQQVTSQLEATTANVRAEVEIAVRDVETAFREIVSKYHAVTASEADIQYLTARWHALPGDQQNAGFALDELLAAQERLAQAEFDFACAEAAYNVALISLNRAMGTLVSAQNVEQVVRSRGVSSGAQQAINRGGPLNVSPGPTNPTTLPPVR
jgi:outer membrane protein TolC